jgi:hypothetical protein
LIISSLNNSILIVRFSLEISMADSFGSLILLTNNIGKKRVFYRKKDIF